VVQLAISQKKMLGYLNGAVVPYRRSQSMVKERCAEKQRPCTNAARGTTAIATWGMVRECLQEILFATVRPGSVPLSNIKRIFRSRYHIELSETALGHAKLSELLQDPRLQDLCTVQLRGHGYVVVPTCTQCSRKSEISELGAAPFLSRLMLQRSVHGDEQQQNVPNPLSPAALSKDGCVGSMVLNTFIHAAPPTTAFRRACSLPKDIGSGKNDWETAFHALSFMPRPEPTAVANPRETCRRASAPQAEMREPPREVEHTDPFSRQASPAHSDTRNNFVDLDPESDSEALSAPSPTTSARSPRKVHNGCGEPDATNGEIGAEHRVVRLAEFI